MAAVLAMVTGFVPIGGRDGVQVFQRKDSPTIELAAIAEIEGSPSEVQAVLLDYGSHPKIISRLAESDVLERHANELIVYQHLKLPVIKDRDYTLKIVWDPAQAKGLTFSIDNSRGPMETGKAVRMSVMNGEWVLKPIRGGHATVAVYRVQVDFAGSVPRWMVRHGAAKDLPSLFNGVRRLVAERRARASRLESPQL
jgi:hypothetical protein